MNKEQVLKEAIDYQIAVAKWVKDVFEWHNEQGDSTLESSVDSGPGGGTNPPPPPPPPPTN